MKRQRRLLAAAVAMLAIVPVAPREGRSAEPIWEPRPYHIELLLAADNAPRWTAPRLERLQAAFLADVKAYIGQPWKCEVAIAVGIERRALLRQAVAEANPSGPVVAREGPVDKSIVVALVDQH